MQRKKPPRSPARSTEKTFRVFFQHGWVHLAVQPETRDEVYPEDVRNRMRLLGMPRAEMSRIRELIQEADGHPHRLIEWPEGVRLTAELTTEIADDEMQAVLYITPWQKGAAPPTPADMQAALEQTGVTAGLDRAAIEDTARRLRHGDTRPPCSFTAARGSEPVFGSAHRIRYHFQVDRGKPYLEMDFGRINLKELNFIEMAEPDQLLAELLPPIEAVDGITVTGRPIPAASDEQTVELQAGENTRLDEDGSRLYAACEGNVLLRNDAVTVEPVVTVENVDYATGNIHFEGSVIVEGGVADGFEVHAGGDIQVARGVGRANLTAGRNILLQSGMNGNGSGSLETRGDLYAKYLESCSVRCGGSLFLEEAVMHSTVVTERHCLLNGRRAEIIGGELVAGGCCWCKKLGNLNETPTSITIGIAPALVGEYRQAAAALEGQLTQLDEVRTRQEQLDTAAREGLSSPKIDIARRQLQEQADELNAETSRLRSRIPELREKLESARESILVVEDTIFPGTSVWFGRQEYRAPDNGARKTILQYRAGKIQESGFNLREAPKINFTREQIQADQP